MKKFIVFLTLFSLLLVPLNVSAAVNAVSTVSTKLTFGSSYAVCEVDITARSSSDSISAVIKLYQDGTCIQTWNASDTGNLNFKAIKVVDKGHTYKLTVDPTIAGVLHHTYTEEAKYN